MADLQGLSACAWLQEAEFCGSTWRELIAQGLSQAGKVASREWRFKNVVGVRSTINLVISNNGKSLCQSDLLTIERNHFISSEDWTWNGKLLRTKPSLSVRCRELAKASKSPRLLKSIVANIK